jgi:hypothetical protein
MQVMDDRRTTNLGKRVQILEEIDKLSRQIHQEVKGLRDAFEPRDVDMSYIKDINTDDVRVFSGEIIKHKKAYDKLIVALKQINRELGIEEE